MSDKSSKSNGNDTTLLFIVLGLVTLAIYENLSFSHTSSEKFLFISFLSLCLIFVGYFYYSYFSAHAKELQEKKKLFDDVPLSLKTKSADSVRMGIATDFNHEIFLPDNIRRRHVHILGVTGSGKTESVILNFLKQDISRGLGSIILDAKGDQSFVDFLKANAPKEKVQIFDLSDKTSVGYNPLSEGSALESAQRLFSSMTWSEEYYKSKAFSALLVIFEDFYQKTGRNPTIKDIKKYLEVFATLADVLNLDVKSKAFEAEFKDLSGLRDQIRSLCIGHFESILSPSSDVESINLSDVFKGKIIYFRLQSLLAPQAVQVIGKLIIQNINFLTGNSHRGENTQRKIVPIYLDEFASFASSEFADLISKARSAGFALHFSHQSNGDLAEVSQGFLNRITDNSATKIVLRVNDPDTAEFYSRAFGTKIYHKMTKQVANASENTSGDSTGSGTVREAHQFRSSPDRFKTLPTGVGSVLIAHGEKTKEGASHVFTIQFPKLT